MLSHIGVFQWHSHMLLHIPSHRPENGIFQPNVSTDPMLSHTFC